MGEGIQELVSPRKRWDSQDDKMGRGALVCVAEVGVVGEAEAEQEGIQGRSVRQTHHGRVRDGTEIREA